VQALHPGIHRRHRLDLGGGPVRGVIVHEDDLPAGLAQGRLDKADQLADIRPFIEGRNDDRQLQGGGCG